MFEDLEGIERNADGYHWRCGWNDALRRAMDYAAPAQPVAPASALKLLQEMVDLCALGDIDEHTDDGLGWAGLVRDAKALIAAAPSASVPPEAPRLTIDNAPLGTKAPDIYGGHWVKTKHGWKWHTGDTFPRPGGDWTGELIAPPEALTQPTKEQTP